MLKDEISLDMILVAIKKSLAKLELEPCPCKNIKLYIYKMMQENLI